LNFTAHACTAGVGDRALGNDVGLAIMRDRVGPEKLHCYKSWLIVSLFAVFMIFIAEPPPLIDTELKLMVLKLPA